MKRIGAAGILITLFGLSGCATLGQLLPGGEWEASQIAQDPAVLYLHRKGSGASEVFYVASKLDAGLFKQLLRSPEGYWYLPMGRQERLEKAIDEACTQIQAEKK